MNNNNVFSKKSIKNKTLMEETPYWENTATLVGGLAQEEDEDAKDEKGKPLKGLALLKRIYGSSTQEPKGGKRTAKEIKKFIEASYNEKNPPKEIEGFLLDTELSNKTAKVYHNPTTNETVIAHRGTQGITDWANNLAYVTGNYEKTDRYKKGKKNQKKAEAKYGADTISTLGHSQGAIISRKTGANTKEIIGVNPASMGEKPLANEYNVRTSGDLVSKMLPSGKNVTTIKSKTSNPLTEHSAKNLKQIKNQEIGAGIKISYNDMDNQCKGGRRRALNYSANDIDWVNDGLLDDDDEMVGGDIFKSISKGAKSLGKKISKGSKSLGKDIGSVAKKGYQTINKTALKQDWGGAIETVKEPLLEVLEPVMSSAMEAVGVPAPVASTISASAVGSAKAVNFSKSLKGQGQKALDGAIHGAITGAVSSMSGGEPPEEGAGRRRRRMRGGAKKPGEYAINIDPTISQEEIIEQEQALAEQLAYQQQQQLLQQQQQQQQLLQQPITQEEIIHFINTQYNPEEYSYIFRQTFFNFLLEQIQTSPEFELDFRRFYSFNQTSYEFEELIRDIEGVSFQIEQDTYNQEANNPNIQELQPRDYSPEEVMDWVEERWGNQSPAFRQEYFNNLYNQITTYPRVNELFGELTSGLFYLDPMLNHLLIHIQNETKEATGEEINDDNAVIPEEYEEGAGRKMKGRAGVRYTKKGVPVSRASQIVSAMEAKRLINLQKIKNPSQWLKDKYGKKKYVRKQRGVKGARGKRGAQKTAKMTVEEQQASRKATLAKARAKTISLSSEIRDVVKAIPTMNYLELMELKPTLIRFNNAERTKAEDNNLEKLKKAFNKRSEELKESNKGRTQGMALARARDISDDDVIEGFGRQGKGLTNKIVKHLDKDNKEMIKLHRAFQKHMDTEEATK